MPPANVDVADRKERSLGCASLIAVKHTGPYVDPLTWYP